MVRVKPAAGFRLSNFDHRSPAMEIHFTTRATRGFGDYLVDKRMGLQCETHRLAYLLLDYTRQSLFYRLGCSG